MRQPPESAIIIGAGVGGLALANILAKAGTKVTVCEKSATAGGRFGSLSIDGFRFDTGPSWYLMPEVFETYFDRLGLSITDYIPLHRLTPAYKVFFQSEPAVEMFAKPGRDSATFEAIEPGAGRALSNYLATSKQSYDIASEQILYNNFHIGSWMLSRQIVGSLYTMTRLLLSSVHGHVRRSFVDHRLQKVLEYPTVFLGTDPYHAPAIYNLMSHMDLTQGVYYPKKGFYSIIEALVQIGESHGVTYLYNSPVASIMHRNGQASGVELKNGQTLVASCVISNADLHLTETQLLSPEARSYPESFWQKRQSSPSAFLIHLGIKGRLPELTHHNLFFVDDWEPNFKTIREQKAWPLPGSMYVSKTSATDKSVAPDGDEAISILVIVPGMTSNEIDYDAYAQKYIDQFSEMAGIADLEQRIVTRHLYGPEDFKNDFNAWDGAALGLSHTLNQSALFRPANRSRRLKNVYYVGANTVPGIGVPLCLISAEMTYRRIIGDKRVGPDRSSSS